VRALAACRFTATSASAVYISFGTVKCVDDPVPMSQAAHLRAAAAVLAPLYEIAAVCNCRRVQVDARRCNGGCRYDYGVAILVLGFVATMLGQMGAHWLMTRLQRRSVIVFCMAALL
jgi:hypothetical protein